MTHRNTGRRFLILVLAVLGIAETARSQNLIAHWTAESLQPGTTFTVGGPTWQDQVGSWGATAEAFAGAFNAPEVDPTRTIGLNGRQAVSFNEPDTGGGGLKVDAGEGDPMRSPLVGLSSWSATIVFQTSDPAGGGGGNTDPGSWWMNGGLIGIELGGGDRGDWGIWMTDGNATSGAKLGASRGDTDGGVFYDQAVNDGNAHVVTATYRLSDDTFTHEVDLYLDGEPVGSSETISGGLNNAIENFEMRIGSFNNFGFFKGRMGEIMLHDGALPASTVQSLFDDFDAYYGITGTSTGDPDFDGDGDIDGRDFLRWQRGYGLIGQTTNINGDANLDGVVDGVDLGIWQDQYGSSSLAIAVAVPEPASMLLVLGACFGLIASRRSRT